MALRDNSGAVFCSHEICSGSRHAAGVLQPVGNWSYYVDKLVLSGHMQTKLWESKSLLGCLPALVTTLIGVLTGIYLRTSVPVCEKLTHLYFYGSVCMGVGAVWSLWFPVNQNLWTSSLVMLMSGLALIFLATCYYLVDFKQTTWWTLPCLIYGANSILVWVLSQLGMKTLQATPLGRTEPLSVSGRRAD